MLFSDVIEHNQIAKEQVVLENLLNIVSSSVGSLTNPTKLSDSFRSAKQFHVTSNTIGKYLDYFIDAFIVYKALRYDINGKKYIEPPLNVRIHMFWQLLYEYIHSNLGFGS